MTHQNDFTHESSPQQHELNPGAVVIDIQELAKAAPAGSLYQRLSEAFAGVDPETLDANELYRRLDEYLRQGTTAGVEPYSIAEHTLPADVRGHVGLVRQDIMDRVHHAVRHKQTLLTWTDPYVVHNVSLRDGEVVGGMWITDYEVDQSNKPTDRGFLFSDQDTTQYTVWFAEGENGRVAACAGPRNDISERVIATLDLHVPIASL